MLLHCDMVIAAADAFLRFPFVDRGITPEGASTLLLPRRIGLARAMDLFLTGRRIYAPEALSVGLVSRIAQGTSAADDAIEVARTIAQKDRSAVVATKKLVRFDSDEALPMRFEREIDTINALLESGRRSS